MRPLQGFIELEVIMPKEQRVTSKGPWLLMLNCLVTIWCNQSGFNRWGIYCVQLIWPRYNGLKWTQILWSSNYSVLVFLATSRRLVRFGIMVPNCAKSSLKPILRMLLWKMKPVEAYLNIFRDGSIESEWHDYLKDLATWGWNQE